MSFSGDIKKELAKTTSKRRHCQIAELIFEEPSECSICVQTENIFIAKKYCTLLKKCFNIYAEIAVRCHSVSKNVRIYRITVCRSDDCLRIVETLKLPHAAHTLVSPLLLQQTCCKRAFLRGAFLMSGSMSNPEKSYHLEFVCDTESKALQLQELLNGFSLNARTVPRKKQFVVYLKEGEQIVDLLNLMEAHVALMAFENIRILRDIANTINRQTNCDVANSQKTVTASSRQRDDILLIEKTSGLSSLPPTLQEIACLRLENPELPIRDLGAMLSPPLGKSGVNHRFRKLSQIADRIRGNQ